MEKSAKKRKITVILPDVLIKTALDASGDTLTATISRGLQLVAAQQAYRNLLRLKGKLNLDLDLDELRKDRDE